MAGALSLLRNLTPRGRLKLGGAVLGALIALVLLFKVAGHTSYETLMAGIDTSQTSKITGALDSAGVSYKLGNGGTEISVAPSQYSQARVALATQGLDTGTAAQPGFELFDKQKLGASDFTQQVTYQRALEGQIAQTIEGIQGVGTAQVQLVIPRDQLFTSGSQKATAAVLLSGAGDALGSGAVQGIANLVASSVKGLTTKNVTITDGSGAMLWPSNANGGTNPTSTPNTKIAAQSSYESTLDAQLASMLAATVGPDKARVQTNVVLDTNQASQDTLRYATKGVPTKATKDVETLKGKNTSLAGVSGASANVTGYATTGGNGNSTTDYKHTTGSTDYGVNKTVTHTNVAPGTVQRLKRRADARQQACPRPRSPASRPRWPTRPVSSPRAATRSPSPSCRSPSRR